MNSWLRFLLGLKENEIPAGADSRFELTRLYHGTAAWLAGLLALGAVLLIVALYRSERDLTRAQRLVLSFLRLLALALVIFMLLDPRILTEIRRERAAQTFLLVDTSASMGQRDTYDGDERKTLEGATGLSLAEQRSRAELVLAAIEHQKLLPSLAEKNKLRLFTFDSKATEATQLDRDAVLAAGGDATRLGDAIRSVLKQAGGDPVAGIVVLSDGRLNGGEPVGKSAADAAMQGVPIYTVAVGKSGLPKNYAVTEVSAPDVVEAGFPVRINARIEASGIKGPLKVTLSRAGPGGGPMKKIEEKTLDEKGLQSSTSVVFLDTPEKKGKYRYVASVAVHAEEVDKTDNKREVSVTAAEEKCRVLLVAGNSTFEYTHLKSFLLRDPGLQVSCWLTSADKGYPQEGDVVIKELPQNAEKLRVYDAVVLLDPDPRSLSPEFVQGLSDFVLEQGGGLAYVAGEAYTSALVASRGPAPLLALLPVELGGSSARARGQVAYVHQWRPRLTRQGMDHPLCRLVDDTAENEKLWTTLPPFRFFVPIQELKPLATALLERENGGIVAATQQAGAGYTFFAATDDLHSWRDYRQEIYERYWAGVVRYLALGKKLQGSREVSLTTDRDRYTVGDEVVFEASVTDAERKPVITDRLEMVIERQAAEGPAADPPVDSPRGDERSASFTINLIPAPGRPGWYIGRMRPEKAGRYTGLLRSPGGNAPRLPSSASGEPAGSGKASFSVLSLTTELEDPSPDPSTLEDLAARTGGGAFGLDGLEEISKRIPDRRISEIVGRAASTVWDSAALMLLFTASLCAEWILRKIWRLN
jgi:hypothetical protein